MNEPLNPGESNLIYVLGGLYPNFNTSEFINGVIKDKLLDIQFEGKNEYGNLRIDVDVNYIVTNSLGNELYPVSLHRVFKMVKVKDVEPVDIRCMLDYCKSILNETISQRSPKPSYLPESFEVLDLGAIQQKSVLLYLNQFENSNPHLEEI